MGNCQRHIKRGAVCNEEVNDANIITYTLNCDQRKGTKIEELELTVLDMLSQLHGYVPQKSSRDWRCNSSVKSACLACMKSWVHYPQ